MHNQKEADFFYPPGGILIWMIICLEVSVFLIALLVMKQYAHAEAQVFSTSAHMLSLNSGVTNTLILLTSGYFMATALRWYRMDHLVRYKKYLLWTILAGGLFTLIKIFEYGDKLNHGQIIGTNTFFTFYWLITGFHLLHVLVGMTILLYLYAGKPDADSSDYTLNLEAGASFWHMCDLIWVIIFPVFYLCQ